MWFRFYPVSVDRPLCNTHSTLNWILTVLLCWSHRDGENPWRLFYACTFFLFVCFCGPRTFFPRLIIVFVFVFRGSEEMSLVPFFFLLDFSKYNINFQDHNHGSSEVWSAALVSAAVGSSACIVHSVSRCSCALSRPGWAARLRRCRPRGCV